MKSPFSDVEWCVGILIDTNKKIKFSRYTDIPMDIGNWFNCVNKKKPEQKYRLEKIENGIYYFKEVEYPEISENIEDIWWNIPQ